MVQAEDNQTQSWKITADRTTASHDNQMIEAFGNVVLERGADYIRAEYARYYQTTKWVFLKGTVKARFQGDFLEAEEAEFDLNTNLGWLKNGKVFLEDPHMYFGGELLKRTGAETYEFREATVTVCDGDRPAWSIKSSRGDITRNGYAHLWTPKFQILDQPVMASPYAVIPVKTQRQSGFLMPEFGISDRLGTFYNQPYYQVIDEERDVTLYSNVMTSKGVMFGAEYREAPDLHTKGLWRLDYLFDTTTEAESLYSNEPSMSRQNQNRWWARGKYDGYLSDPEWILKFDLDLVSDQDYLREFNHGYEGFRNSRKDFLEYFGRDIEDKDNNLRINRALISHNWANFGVQGLLEYTQNLTYGSNNYSTGHGHADDPTLQRLPEIDFNLYQTRLGTSPFSLEGTSQVSSFWRAFGTTGTRMDIHPILSYPLHSMYGSLIPKAGLRNTSYFITQYENESSAVDTSDKTPNRFFPDFSTTAYTEFSRIYSINDEIASNATDPTWLKLKHAVQPRLEYVYIPLKDQSKYPYFDEIDSINATNDLRYSLVNVFTRKSGSMMPDPDNHGQMTSHYDYRELVRLNLEQDYDFREASRNDELSKYPRRPFSDLLFDVTTSLTPWLALTNKTWYSPYESKITEHEHGLTAYWPEKGFFHFGLDFLSDMDEYKRQDQERQDVANFSGAYSFMPQWNVGFLYRKDYNVGEDLEKKLVLRYDHQCFSTEASWDKTDTDSRLEFRVILAQLGSLGR